tara:strand:- start:200 stop:811 length:612 start_codon:yes stop_codon:yes gene_type:complete
MVTFMLDLLNRLQMADYPPEEKEKLIKENGNTCKVCNQHYDNADFKVFIKYTDCISEQTIEENAVVCCNDCEVELKDFFSLFRLYDVVNHDALFKVFQIFISKGREQFTDGELAVPKFVQKSLASDFWANFDKTVGSYAAHRRIFYLLYRYMLDQGRLSDYIVREDYFYEESTLSGIYYTTLRSAGQKEHLRVVPFGKFLKEN